MCHPAGDVPIFELFFHCLGRAKPKFFESVFIRFFFIKLKHAPIQKRP